MSTEASTRTGEASNEDKRHGYEKRDLRDGRVCSINASTLQRFNASTLQRFNASTLQRFNASTLQRFSMYCVVLAMSGLYQAAKGYVRCLRWLARFSPATICLALAFVFSGTIGAVAQNADPVADTTGPTGLFEGLVAERTHDGMTPINFAVEFKEPVVGFTADDINRDSWFLPADLDPTLIDPTISEFEQDSTRVC